MKMIATIAEKNLRRKRRRRRRRTEVEYNIVLLHWVVTVYRIICLLLEKLEAEITKGSNAGSNERRQAVRGDRALGDGELAALVLGSKLGLRTLGEIHSTNELSDNGLDKGRNSLGLALYLLVVGLGEIVLVSNSAETLVGDEGEAKDLETAVSRLHDLEYGGHANSLSTTHAHHLNLVAGLVIRAGNTKVASLTELVAVL